MTSGNEENFDGAIESVRKELEKLRFDKGLIEGSEFIYADYIKRLSKKSCCPLCKRNFDQESEAKSLLSSVQSFFADIFVFLPTKHFFQINRTLNDVPEEKDRLRQEIGAKESKLKQMHQLQPTAGMAHKLRAVEIPFFKAEVEQLVDEYKKLKSEMNEVSITF